MTISVVYEIAHAKINLYLDVLNKRQDGYHNIVSVMHTVAFGDTVGAERMPAGEEQTVLLQCPGVEGDPENNLATRAVRAFMLQAGIERYRIAVEIEKKIPQGAGLGGGSADCAAVLRCLNRLYNNLFTPEQLCAIGGKLGADVPFCVFGGAALVQGIGEILSPFPTLPPCRIAVCFGGEPVSTPFAYGEVDKLNVSVSPSVDALREAMTDGGLKQIAASLYNRFEAAILPHRPVPSSLMQMMREEGALGTLMSGSGAAVFGIFDWNRNPETVQARAEQMGCLCAITEPYALGGNIGD